jgi:beta-ribofuranosylaminobenzene 5'-phosphate synthase
VEEAQVKVYVRTPARLHFGLIDMRGDLGRFFGGLGVAIDKPNVVLEVQPSESFSVTGEETDRATMFARRFLEAYEIEGGFNIHVEKTIPEHVGLGSGTQLALAIAAALARLFKVTVPIPELSLSMERIKRTSVGTAVFEQGGFVVDGGKKMKNKVIIPQVCRSNPPC